VAFSQDRLNVTCTDRMCGVADQHRPVAMLPLRVHGLTGPPR
jgi:hypothetical protein